MKIRDADKVQLVKDKAIELIVKEGLEGFSMNKLAKACRISVGTLYIYYRDRDDLIIKITTEELKLMEEAILKDFNSAMLFEQGLRKQWQNRFLYALQKPNINLFFDQLRSSSYQQEFLSDYMSDFIIVMSGFMQNIIANGEIDPISAELYWSVAFSPLYNLLRLNNEGRGIDGKPFKLTETILWSAFDMVIKALKK